LKQARPSLAGSPAPIASMRAIASATDVTGAVGVGGPAGMATLYEKPGGPTGVGVPGGPRMEAWSGAAGSAIHCGAALTTAGESAGMAL
jgi:hypothetical protein